MARDDDADALQEKLMSDDDLLERFRKDPTGVMSEHGIELSDEEHHKLAAALTKSPDEVRTALNSRPLKTMY